MNNGRPLTDKQTVRLMIALTILAWATQTLVHQWTFGQTIASSTTETFSTATSSNSTGTTLELRSEASVVGGEVTLRQICRWADRDKSLFDPIGDLVLSRMAEQQPFKTLTLGEVRGLLHDAGVNIATINFCGATGCTVARTDVHYDEKTALKDWADAKLNDASAASARIAAAPSSALIEIAPGDVQTLKSLLIADLAKNLGLPSDSLQVDFQMTDEKVINYSKPLFSFEIDSTHARSLGGVNWLVAVTHDGVTKKSMVYASAKAWQEQIVAAKPLAFHQIIREGDVESRRTLVADTSNDSPVTLKQCIGQLAGRDLKIGSQITGRCVDPVQLVKREQFVTITFEQGSISVKSVGRALENGTFGQPIRVKNEQTGEVLQVVVTGPQAATMSLNSTLASAEGH